MKKLVAGAALAGACLALLCGCNDSSMPGKVLGMYKVVGQSTSNTCGLGAPSPWTFDVQLSQQGTTLYWSWLDGSPLLSGPLGSGSAASLKSSGTLNADSTDAGLGPCNLERDADLEVALASGSPPPSFGGTIGYAFQASGGSDCRDQLTASGGMFDALPCAVSYTVSATRQ